MNTFVSLKKNRLHVEMCIECHTRRYAFVPCEASLCPVQAEPCAAQPQVAVTVAGEMIKSLLHSCRAAGSGVNMPLPADAALRVRG